MKKVENIREAKEQIANNEKKTINFILNVKTESAFTSIASTKNKKKSILQEKHFQFFYQS